jgi:hypothetical protein
VTLGRHEEGGGWRSGGLGGGAARPRPTGQCGEMGWTDPWAGLTARAEWAESKGNRFLIDFQNLASL